MVGKGNEMKTCHCCKKEIPDGEIAHVVLVHDSPPVYDCDECMALSLKDYLERCSKNGVVSS